MEFIKNVARLTVSAAQDLGKKEFLVRVLQSGDSVQIEIGDRYRLFDIEKSTLTRAGGQTVKLFSVDGAIKEVMMHALDVDDGVPLSEVLIGRGESHDWKFTASDSGRLLIVYAKR